ncbi:DNA repair protein RecO [Kaarinaea lacus]
MFKHRVLLQPAYVLHLKPYRDTSALVEVFTPEYGRVALVAKGIKRGNSKLRGLLQPFSPILASWSGKGELHNLNNAEPQGKARLFKAQVLTCGLYVNELLMRLSQRDENQVELFGAYNDTLNALQQYHEIEDDPLLLQNLLRQFELKMLDCLGYGLVLRSEALSGRKIQPDEDYDYQLELGPVLTIAQSAEPGYGVRVRGETLLALADDKMMSLADAQQRFREAKRLMRFVLDHYLGSKPLMSRQLLKRTPTML